MKYRKGSILSYVSKIEDSLSVWNRTATDHTSTTRIRDTLRRILNIPLTTAMEYKIHCDSLKYVAINKGPLKS
ncbi:unnamed protein product [Ceratitis capitata]|uniref:(Mediterranean fruit fly) hypothetical protein n=1 Tax=Ceratitis capitata TaxID=7213 RepID=A0A811UCT1_CERCA|nr:unnamed protein product [Ceratitis capitata]